MNALRRHWPEYLMEAWGLGVFMLAAGMVVAILEHPASILRQTIADPSLRRLILGIVMGLTAIAVIYSPWGKQSGAHINPVVTFTFFRLGKVTPWDTFFYIAAQFAGGLTGLLLVGAVLRGAILLRRRCANADPAVNYIVTVPGSGGVGVAFLAELIISFGLMITVLFVSNNQKPARWTGVFAGILVATYITIEAPLSGMSMNPARTVASALHAQVWTAIWIYFIAPLLGMLLAAEVYVQLMGAHAVRCAKLHHQNNKRCIFLHCGYRHQRMRNGPQLLSNRLL